MNTEWITTTNGVRVRKECLDAWIAREDLSPEQAEDWVVTLHELEAEGEFRYLGNNRWVRTDPRTTAGHG